MRVVPSPLSQSIGWHCQDPPVLRKDIRHQKASDTILMISVKYYDEEIGTTGEIFSEGSIDLEINAI